MEKVVFLVLVAAFVAADPKPGVLAPVVAPAVVTAQSSQVFARNYNALVAAPLLRAAPVVAAPVVRAAPIVAAPHLHSPYLATPHLAHLAAPHLAAPHLAAPLVL